MREKYKQLSGFDADDASDIGIRLRLLAEQAAIAYSRAETLEKQVFPQTSTGGYLDMHAGARGISRKPAIAATGVLSFTREIPAASDIQVEKGVICATKGDPQIRYVTVEKGVLAAGQSKIDVRAQAVEPGRPGNAAPGAICLMVTAAPGFSGVANASAFSGGVDEENDDTLRARLLESYRYISNGTNRAFYYDVAMAHAGVVSANVIPRKRGRGTVDIIVALAPGMKAADILPALRAELENKKEVNVDILAEEAQLRSTSLSIQIQAADGSSHDVTAESCKSAVEGYMNGLAVGEALLMARLGGVIMSVPGIYNYKLTSGDVTPLESQVIRPGNIAVDRMI